MYNEADKEYYENNDEYYIYDWDDEYDITEDDICCWDIRYKGPKNRCFCQEYHESVIRSEHWFFGRYDKFVISLSYHLTNIKEKLTDFFDRKYCHKCEKKSFKRKYSHFGECPKCGHYETDLPF